MLDVIILAHEERHIQSGKLKCDKCGLYTPDVPPGWVDEECKERFQTFMEISEVLPYLDPKCADIAKRYLELIEDFLAKNCSGKVQNEHP